MKSLTIEYVGWHGAQALLAVTGVVVLASGGLPWLAS
jgi:hypothetical protein